MGGDRPEEGRHPHGKKVGIEMNEVKKEVLNAMEKQRKVGLQECRHLQVVAEPEDLKLWGCWTLSGLGWKDLVGGGGQTSTLALGAAGGKGGIYNAPVVPCGSESSIRSFMVVCRMM